MGTQLLSPKEGQSAQFSAHFYCGQTAGCIKMPLGMEVSLSPGDFVSDGDPSPSPKRGGAFPQFVAHVYCGQTAAWIKMPLDTEVVHGLRDFVSRHCVRWGPNSPLLKDTAPNFRPMSVVAKRLDGLRCHLVWRWASAQATLCSTGTQLSPEQRAHPPHPIFGGVV